MYIILLFFPLEGKIVKASAPQNLVLPLIISSQFLIASPGLTSFLSPTPNSPSIVGTVRSQFKYYFLSLINYMPLSEIFKLAELHIPPVKSR